MNPINKIIKRMSSRTLKIDILTVFLSIIIISFSLVIFYSYYKNYNSVMIFSRGVMERNSHVILDRINILAIKIEDTLQDTSALFLATEKLSIENDELVNFMLDILKFNENISSYFLGMEKTGDLIQVSNIRLTTQTHYISDSSKILPQNAVYSVKIIDHSDKISPEIIIYKDINFKTLFEEKLPKTDMDVHARPWYVKAINDKDLFWTDIYTFIDTNELGISVSKPIYKKNTLIGVIGADLSFAAFSDFLMKQKIGHSGHAFLVNSEGKILVPEVSIIKNSGIMPEAVHLAYQHYKKSLDNNFVLEYKNTKYLAYIGKTPENFDQNWLIIIIVPFADFFAGLIQTQFEIVLITIIILLLSIFIMIYFSKKISKPIVTLSKEIDKITNLDLSSKKRVRSHIIEVKTMDISVATLRNSLKSFAKYIPKEIVKKLLHIGKEINLYLEKKQLTIFFSDIQNFTTMVEVYSIDKLLPLINEYFDELSKIILVNQGTIDKYIGDSIMAFWNAPLDDHNHAYHACITALRCQNFLEKFNKKCRETNSPEFCSRFGLNTGEVLVGNIGTNERMNYTILGDAVNIASRLESTNKIYHTHIIISEKVYQVVKDSFLVRPLDIVEVKGKKKKIKIYELIALIQADPDITATQLQIELFMSFSEAYEAYEAGNFKRSKALFAQIYSKFPDDYPTQIYLDRLREKSG